MKMTAQPAPHSLLSEAEAIAAMKSGSPYKRREGVESLAVLGVRIDLLFNAVEDANPWVRGTVATSARRLAAPDAVGLVSVLIDDRNPNVVVETLETIATLGLAEFAGRVALAAQSADHRVRAAAIRTLGFLGGDQVPAAVATGLLDASPKVRIRSAEVARALADPELVTSLVTALTTECAAAEPHENLVATLCQGLVACDSTGASGSVLVDAVVKVPGVRAATCKALAKLGYEPARTIFERFAVDATSAETRALGVRSLGSLGPQPSWEIVLGAVKDPDLSVRAAALRALGEAPDGNRMDYLRTAARLALDAVSALQTMRDDTALAEPLVAEAQRALDVIAATIGGGDPLDWGDYDIDE